MKPIIDFHILPIDDPRYIIVSDASLWEHIESLPAIIEITMPGSSEKITHYFQKAQLNQYQSINLYQNCLAPCGCEGTELLFLPDGIYTIRVTGSGSEDFYTEKYHLKTSQLQLKVDKLYVGLNCENISLDKKDKLEEIDFLIYAAEANTRLGNVKDAHDLYMKASSLADKIECKNCK